MEFKWIKQHPLSACSVGDVETIENEARIAELKEGKYITPYDPANDTTEEVDPIKELNDAEEKYQALVKENGELVAQSLALHVENGDLKAEITALKAEIETLKAASTVAPKTK